MISYKKYKKIWKAIAGYNENGGRTGYSKVIKNNGKTNYIDIQTGEEISPIDFYSATLMDPDTNDFQIEYPKDVFYQACNQGFFLNEEEYESGEGHTFDELPEITKQRFLEKEQQVASIRENRTLFQIICESVLNEVQQLIDNFDKVSNILEFKTPDDFYFVQIIKRFKDNPNDDRSQGNYHAGAWYLKGYRIRSVEELQKLKPEIIKMCHDNNARAYITVNSRSEKETNDFIKIYKKQFRPTDARYQHADDIIPGQAKDGPAWKGKRPRLIIDIDVPEDTKGPDGQKIWDEVRYMLNMVGITPLAEYETPSGGLHIILSDKEDKRLQYLKRLFMKFDNWQDRGRLATVHPNIDAKLILYSNVQTKGY